MLPLATPRRRSASRCGITLFEVVLALAIFLGALASISQVLRNGSRANVQSRIRSEAALRCETQLNEIAAGSLPLESVSQSPFEDDPSWTWSVLIADTEMPDLLEVQVTVEHTRPSGIVDQSFQLTRLMRDPQMFLDAAVTGSESEP